MRVSKQFLWDFAHLAGVPAIFGVHKGRQAELDTRQSFRTHANFLTHRARARVRCGIYVRHRIHLHAHARFAGHSGNVGT